MSAHRPASTHPPHGLALANRAAGRDVAPVPRPAPVPEPRRGQRPRAPPSQPGPAPELSHLPARGPRGPAAPTTTNGPSVTSSAASARGLESLPVIPKGTKLEGARRAKFLQQILPVYDDGASIRAISDRTQRSYGSIQSLLGGAGVLRGRGGGPHQRRPRASDS
ncbi:helix-turn-helix domain-containing protein [Streptomyces anulatus]